MIDRVAGQLARNFELSIAAHSNSTPADFADDRSKEINSTNQPHRFALRAIDWIALHKPKHAKTAIDFLAQLAGGVEYLGCGFSSTIYKKGNEVIKVHRSTVRMSEEQRNVYADDLNRSSSTVFKYLGGVAVSQDISVGLHPLGGNRSVLAHQEYITGSPLDLFTPNTTVLNRSAAAAFLDTSPDGLGQLRRLAGKTIECAERENVAPDINGAGNLIIERGAVRLVDTIPVLRQEYPTIYSLILNQANILNDYLDTY